MLNNKDVNINLFYYSLLLPVERTEIHETAVSRVDVRDIRRMFVMSLAMLKKS